MSLLKLVYWHVEFVIVAEVDMDQMVEQVDLEIMAFVQHQEEEFDEEELDAEELVAFSVFEFVNEDAGFEDYQVELDSDAQLFFVLLQDEKVEQR